MCERLQQLPPSTMKYRSEKGNRMKKLAIISISAVLTKKQSCRIRKMAKKRLGRKYRVLVLPAGVYADIVK